MLKTQRARAIFLWSTFLVILFNVIGLFGNRTIGGNYLLELAVVGAVVGLISAFMLLIWFFVVLSDWIEKGAEKSGKEIKEDTVREAFGVADEKPPYIKAVW